MKKYRIREVLKEKGILQKDLAEQVGITPSSLARRICVEDISPSLLSRIAAALNVEECELRLPQIDNNDDFEIMEGITYIQCPHCKCMIEVEITPKKPKL